MQWPKCGAGKLESLPGVSPPVNLVETAPIWRAESGPLVGVGLRSGA